MNDLKVIVLMFMLVIGLGVVLYKTPNWIDGLLKYFAFLTMALVCVACAVYLMNNAIFWDSALGK